MGVNDEDFIDKLSEKLSMKIVDNKGNAIHPGLVRELENSIYEYMLNGGEEFYDLDTATRKKFLTDALYDDEFITLRYLYSVDKISDASKRIDFIIEMVNNEKNIENKWSLEEIQYNMDSTFRLPIDRKSSSKTDFKLRDDLFYFFVQPSVSVELECKQLTIPDYLKDLFQSTPFEPINIRDYEFFERHSGFKAIIDDIFGKPLSYPLESLDRKIIASDFRQNNLSELVYDTGAKRSFFNIFSLEEIQELNDFTPALMNYIIDSKNYVVDDSVFTAFGDKEKIHIQILELSKKSETIFVPYFVGLGNNYPFTRAINKRTSFGDDRFYRESFNPIEKKFYVQQYKKNGTWKNNISVYNFEEFKDILINKAKNPKKSIQDLLGLIDNTQSVYKDYFLEVFDIKKLFDDFCKKRGIDPSIKDLDSKRIQDYKLMLDPNIRFKPAALIAYNFLSKM